MNPVTNLKKDNIFCEISESGIYALVVYRRKEKFVTG